MLCPADDGGCGRQKREEEGKGRAGERRDEHGKAGLRCIARQWREWRRGCAAGEMGLERKAPVASERVREGERREEERRKKRGRRGEGAKRNSQMIAALR